MALMATLRSNIAVLERRIAELVAAHPDREVFASLPGAGEVLVPRLTAAFGTHRDRYQNAYEMQTLQGWSLGRFHPQILLQSRIFRT
jgi:hypothetical protein